MTPCSQSLLELWTSISRDLYWPLSFIYTSHLKEKKTNVEISSVNVHVAQLILQQGAYLMHSKRGAASVR